MIKIAKYIIGCLLLHTYTVEIRIRTEMVVNVPLLRVSKVTIRPRVDVSGVINHGG